jgi:hypothetical protein
MKLNGVGRSTSVVLKKVAFSTGGKASGNSSVTPKAIVQMARSTAPARMPSARACDKLSAPRPEMMEIVT